ncbi:hypothetical protein ACIQM4_31580 [Streptomyces sp. NPDC091272]|uniref:hypothetical protein n=1 Tax=Streptomyces sp. NPDC091272 TaxID=3365981 RepID=UPI0038130216
MRAQIEQRAVLPPAGGRELAAEEGAVEGQADHPEAVPYPHSCTPQAWAAATPLAILTALRGVAGGA